MSVLFVLPLVLAAAAVEVRVDSERVSVRAEGALLSEVLDRLAEKTGMKVVWAPNLGRPVITTRLEDCTPAEAVQRLMQGTGFNYALSTDPSGVRVHTLVVVGVPRPDPAPGAFVPRRAEPDEDAVVGVETGEPRADTGGDVQGKPSKSGRPLEAADKGPVRPPRSRP